MFSTLALVAVGGAIVENAQLLLEHLLRFLTQDTSAGG